jgi:NAD(P)-dependent dehydrogenase (short-subunit alcohol dehydrogenase family)
VRVNCIAPGLIKTDMARALWENPDTLKTSTRRLRCKRIGEPHEIAGAAVFLAARQVRLQLARPSSCDGGATISGG